MPTRAAKPIAVAFAKALPAQVLRVVVVIRSATGMRIDEANRTATSALDAEVAAAADVAVACVSARGRY